MPHVASTVLTAPVGPVSLIVDASTPAHGNCTDAMVCHFNSFDSDPDIDARRPCSKEGSVRPTAMSLKSQAQSHMALRASVLAVAPCRLAIGHVIPGREPEGALAMACRTELPRLSREKS